MSRTRLLMGLGVWIFCFWLAACSSNTPNTTTAKNTLIYGLTLEPSGFDPHINQSAEIGIVLRQVYDTLIYRDPSNNAFVPGLALEWVISDDGLVYTFKLRQDVTFHDGTAFNAQAVAANLDRITNPENASQKAVFLLGPYVGYHIIDLYTIQILLSQPHSPLLDAFAQIYLGMASPAAFESYSKERYQFHQVGTGPFRFVEYLPQDRIVLQRNPNYAWGPNFYLPVSEKSPDEIIFRFFIDPPTRTTAVEAGTAQIVGEIAPIDAQIMRGNSKIQLLPTQIPGQPLQFLFNTKRFPTDNLLVRQALLYGTNRNGIVDAVYQGFSPVAWGPLSAATLFYDRALVGTYAHDTGQARNLLAAAGYDDVDNNGFLEINGIDLEITLIVPPWGFIPEVAQLLQDQWRAIGVRAILKPVSGRAALLEEVTGGEYNLVAFNTFGYDPAFLKEYFASTGPTNWTGYGSIELDNILNEASRQIDASFRRNLYTQAQRIIMQEALILPIRDYVNLNATTAGVQGLNYDSYGWFPLLHNVTLTGGE